MRNVVTALLGLMILSAPAANARCPQDDPRFSLLSPAHQAWTMHWHPCGGTTGTGQGGGGGSTQGGGGGTTQGGGSDSGLTITPRLWDPGYTLTASYNVMSVGGSLSVILQKDGGDTVNSAADAEINGAAGMPVTSVSYEYRTGSDGRVGWDIMTSDGVDHIGIVTDGTEGQVEVLPTGWTRRTFLPSQFFPPITPTETIATGNGNDSGYNAPQFAGPVSAVELVYNLGTENGGTGTAILRRVMIDHKIARPLLRHLP